MSTSIANSSDQNVDKSKVLVEAVKGQPMTTSIDIASHFGKLHKNVIKSIKALECTDELNRPGFLGDSNL
ncbi:hypothetical protein [Pseudomonas amygdali]|uniref:hypothetical protein n=1 Tax=Pseudomonas amygdali TaxID=47877 RepID=UPI00128F5914|nr:hypothetical protein [Pseudomonas amygdali]UNO24361.1 hypothetical protein MDO45_18270 [Pseudomonas amygdali pv. aesculi]WGP99255.1 hypothetical protein QFG70_18530 [Pseudomonas amygdali pv. aesculi]